MTHDDRSLERAARSWIEAGPTHAPDRAVGDALLRIQTTPQERDLRIPWRLPGMVDNRVAIAASVVVVVVVGGALAFARFPSIAGPNATTSAPPTGFAALVPYVSPRYGYRVQIPSGWTVIAASEDWHPTDGAAPLEGSSADVFVSDETGAEMRAEIVAETQPTATTSSAWLARWQVFREPGGHCIGTANQWTDGFVAGLPALQLAWRCGGPSDAVSNYDEYAFLASGRGFVIHGAPTLVRQLVDSFGPPPVSQPAFDPARVQELQLSGAEVQANQTYLFDGDYEAVYSIEDKTDDRQCDVTVAARIGDDVTHDIFLIAVSLAPGSTMRSTNPEPLGFPHGVYHLVVDSKSYPGLSPGQETVPPKSITTCTSWSLSLTAH